MRSFILTLISVSCLQLINGQYYRDQEPLGVHIVYGAEPTHQVNIIWWTKTKTPSAIVYYSLIDEEHDDVPIESLSCQHNSKAKGYLARNSTNGKFIQRVFLDNLKPNRRYCYEITSGQESSHIFSFRTADYSTLLAIRDEKYYHSSFIVYGSDISPTLTTQNNQRDNLHDFDSDLSGLIRSFKDQLLDKRVNGFLNLPTIHLKEYSVSNTINSRDFLDYYGSILSNVQILPTLSQMSDSISRQLFQKMFPLKGTVPFNSYFYSIDVNGVHFLSYSADMFTMKSRYGQNNGHTFDATAAGLLETQVNIIEKDLIKANKNRHLVPWVIVLASQSLSCVDFTCDQTTNDIFKKKLESIFYKYNIDLILESSSNLYERSYPVLRTAKKFQTSYDNAEMPIYLSLPKYSVGLNRQNPDKWSAFRYQPHVDNTYGMLEIINSTYMKWSYIYSNKSVIDELTLTKDHGNINKQIQERRKEFLEVNKASNDSKQFKMITFILVLFVLSTGVGYVLVKKRLEFRRMQKMNTNYSNLIESEFDS